MTMALDPSTVLMASPFPRETLKLVRSEVLAGLASPDPPPPQPASRPAARSLAQTVFQPLAKPLAKHLAQPLARSPQPAAPAPMAAPAARVVVAAPLPMRICSPSADPRLMMLADPNGPQAAGFRVLRDTLVTRGLPRVLAVSSPEPGDGKTTCSINLALALDERRAAKLLILDANFAAPALAGMLGIDETTPDPSRERAWTVPFTLAALTPSLHVATLARRPGHSSLYVDFTTFARQLDAFLRAGYHHIILDMPTLDSSPEATLPLQLAGGVLLAVRCGRSKTGELRRAVERIGPGKALGVTLLDAPV